MSKKASIIQADPTAPTPRDPKTGRALDEFGLPLSGPARKAALAKAGKPDPRDDPGAWIKPARSDNPPPAPPAPKQEA